MNLETLPGKYTVCKVSMMQDIYLGMEFCFIGKTGDEISLVCRTQDTPRNVTEREDGWKGFRVAGTLDFSLSGILSKLSGILAENGIALFAVSTYNTDYILVREYDFEKAVTALKAAGYRFV